MQISPEIANAGIESSLKSMTSVSGSPSGDKLPFAGVLGDALSQTNGTQVSAQQAVDQLLAGEDIEIHEVSLQVAQADLSLRFLLEVRNRAISAYQDVMKTQM